MSKYNEAISNIKKIKDCYPTDKNEQLDYVIGLLANAKTEASQRYIAALSIRMGLPTNLGL